MTGHLVALSVRTEMEGKRGEALVQRVRRVEVWVRPRKGQEALKRVRDESLSMVKVKVENVKLRWVSLSKFVISTVGQLELLIWSTISFAHLRMLSLF
jgi:hypothetical protein